MTQRARSVRLGKLTLLQVAFAACLASCAGGGSTSSSVLPSQANAANVSTTLPSSTLPMHGGSVTIPIPVTSSQPMAVGPPGNSSATVAQAPASVSREPVPVTFRFALSGEQTQTALRRKQDASYPGGYTSAAYTPSISLTVTPLGGTAAGPYTGTCTAGTSGNCTVTFTAAPGPTTFSGTISENGTVVSRFSQIQIVQPSNANTIAFTASPVVASVTLQLATPSIVAGTPQSVPLTVLAKDSNGNTIAGTASYVDSNGTPVSISLQAANAQNGGRGTAPLRGALRITSAAQNGTTLQYDGNWLDHTTVTATATSATVSMLSAVATLSTIPHAIEYPAAGTPFGIVTGPDGNIWFTQFGNNAIGRITTNGTGYTSYPCAGCSSPHYIAVGSDGNLWFTEFYGSYVDKITSTGVTTRVAALGGNGVAIVPGPNGNLWFSSDTGGFIGQTTVTGVTKVFPTPSNDQVRGMGFGPDGNIWYLDMTSNTINKMSQTGLALSNFAVPYLGGISSGPCPCSDRVIGGPDGNMWFVNYGSNLIEKITMSGAITGYSLQSNAGPRGTTVGPDGNIWFTETNVGSIGQIKTDGTLKTEYGVANGITAGSGPIGITVGPDGNIWFAEAGANKIAKFVL